MDSLYIKKYVGKLCRIILKNGFEYTARIPTFEGDVFVITDKFKKQITINCSFVDFMAELQERYE